VVVAVGDRTPTMFIVAATGHRLAVNEETQNAGVVAGTRRSSAR
jgi:hypothetical protein